MTDIDFNPLGPLSIVYATDENFAVRCPGDFSELVPDHQLIVRGEDGVIDPAVGLFQIASASVNFMTAGCQPGQVIHLEDDRETFGPDGDYLAVDLVGINYLSLRRIGQAIGAGQPPATVGVSGVRFRVKTAGPQLEEASYEINRQLKIETRLPDTFFRPENLYDRRELRLACVCYALVELYSSQTRTKDSDWSDKITRFTADRERYMGRLSARWGKWGEADLPAQSNRGRVSR